MITEKDKKLLLKDICARLPYGVKVHITNDGFYDKREPYDTILTIQSSHLLKDLDRETGPDAIIIEPYLRPMSSMTEEEEKEINKFLGYRKEINGFGDICCAGWNGDVFVGLDKIYGYLNWLNEHHFDYRGLIDKGLALEAPEDMYKTE